MAGTNRVGRVSSIDYESGTYEVTYADQGRRVTARINVVGLRVNFHVDNRRKCGKISAISKKPR